MAKIDDNDIHGGRTVTHWSGVDGEQSPPRTDNRYRVNDSVRFYVIQICGSFVNVSESAQRVLYRANRVSYVTFEGERHQLRPASRFKNVLEQYTRYKCPVYMAGIDVNRKAIVKIEPWPFIYIAPKLARQAFHALYIEEDEEKYRAILRSATA